MTSRRRRSPGPARDGRPERDGRRSPETATGLAGVGDLEVTGLSGRNKVYGSRIGRGEQPSDALDAMAAAEQTVEGVPAASSPATSSTSATPPPGSNCRCCAPCSRSSTTIPTRWRGWPRPCCHDAAGGGCQIRRRARDHGDVTEELHFEDWGATYGSPYLIEDDAPGEDAELAEPVEPFTITPEAPELRELAFVDGVRRVEGLVYHRGEDGLLARGVVGAHACGAVVVHANPGVAYERLRTRRMLDPRLRAAGEAGAHARVRLGVACRSPRPTSTPRSRTSSAACARPRRGWPSNSRPRAG